jgi:hypothetical protein
MNAVDQVRQAIEDHGRPYWVAYVPMRVVRQLPAATLTELLATAPVNNKNMRERSMLAWAHQHRGETITTSLVAQMMQVSQPTAKNFLKAHTHLFTFVKRGTYKIEEQ